MLYIYNNIAKIITLSCCNVSKLPPFYDSACRCNKISTTCWSHIYILWNIIFHTRL